MKGNPLGLYPRGKNLPNVLSLKSCSRSMKSHRDREEPYVLAQRVKEKPVVGVEEAFLLNLL